MKPASTEHWNFSSNYKLDLKHLGYFEYNNSMQICTRCKEKKPLFEFNFKFKDRGIRQYHCKNCSRLYVRNHYENNRDYYLIKAKKRNTRVRKLMKNYIWEYLSQHNCVDCGENDPIVLEFDHIKEKSFTISSIGRDRTLEEVQREIEKCAVRCANCHRRKTAKQFGWHKSFMPL